MPGTFIFRPIEANLTHDTDWLGNMDPYCAYMLNNKRIKGQVCKSGGQHPIWNEATTVPMEIDQPACVVELMDKDTFIDDSIGTFVIDLNEVRNNGAVSKWYPVFHKNKPAGQILFEAAFQPEGGYVQNTVQYSTPVIAQEIPKKAALIEETVITKEVLPQETYTQSTFISKGGVIPIGSQNLDGGLYGKVVHAEPVSHISDQRLSGTQLHQETLPRTQLGGPLSGSLGGGVLGTRELGAQEFVGGSTYISNTTSEIKHSSAQHYGGSNIGGTNLYGSNLGGTNLGAGNYGSNLGNIQNQNLGNQYLPTQGSNLQDNFNAAHISNAQLGGLYKESIFNPVSAKAKVGQKLPKEGNIIPGDLVGGHTQTNKNIGDQAL
jgi:hypothetical protein